MAHALGSQVSRYHSDIGSDPSDFSAFFSLDFGTCLLLVFDFVYSVISLMLGSFAGLPISAGWNRCFSEEIRIEGIFLAAL